MGYYMPYKLASTLSHRENGYCGKPDAGDVQSENH